MKQIENMVQISRELSLETAFTQQIQILDIFIVSVNLANTQTKMKRKIFMTIKGRKKPKQMLLNKYIL